MAISINLHQVARVAISPSEFRTISSTSSGGGYSIVQIELHCTDGAIHQFNVFSDSDYLPVEFKQQQRRDAA